MKISITKSKIGQRLNYRDRWNQKTKAKLIRTAHKDSEEYYCLELIINGVYFEQKFNKATTIISGDDIYHDDFLSERAKKIFKPVGVVEIKDFSDFDDLREKTGKAIKDFIKELRC